MSGLIERLTVRLTVRFLWRSPAAVAEAVRGFQATEADGVWHLRRGMRAVRDPKQRAEMFTHSLEEESHADEFAAIYPAYARAPFAARHYERRDLYPAGDDAGWRAMAYVNVGEDDATARFKLLADALEDGPLRDSLRRIVKDEEGHVHLTQAMLLRMGATASEAAAAQRDVRLARAWDAWLRAGKRAVNAVAVALLSAAYWLAGPFVAGAARARLRRRVVAHDNNQLKRL
ncbi:MAG: ferritin-like domain-containing protein [Polyangiales bacterium]